MKYWIILCFVASTFRVAGQQVPVSPSCTGVADTAIREPVAIADSANWLVDSTGSKVFTSGKIAFRTDIEPDYTDTIYANRLAAIQKQVPMPFNKDVRSFIDMYVFNRRDQVEKMLGLSKIYFPIFDSIFTSYGVPTELKYLAVIESALNPAAVSRCGAQGLWQFMYGTAKIYNLNINPYYDERSDIFRATEAAAQYLKSSYDLFGDWLLAIASYNSGAGWVQNAIRLSGGNHDFFTISKYLPYETRSYVPIYIAAAYVMNFSEEHNLYPAYPDFNAGGISLVTINDKMSLECISKHTCISMSNLRFLNPALKTNVIPASMNYVLKLPADKMNDFTAKTDTIILESRNAAFYSYAESYLTGQRNLVYHYVKRGEGLYSVARRYGVTVYQLKAWNGLRKNYIYPGQRLVIYSYRPATAVASVPAVKPHYNKYAVASAAKSGAAKKVVYYKVRPGDSLSAISQRYKGVTVASIKADNGMRSNMMHPGQVIKIVMTP